MKNFNILIALAGFFFILVYTLFINHTGFCYDEPYYLSNVDIISRLGWGADFLENLKGPAGPLHAWIHYILKPITEMRVLPTRMVNIVFAFIILFLVYKIIRVINPEKQHVAFLFLAIPMTYPTMGMALTEIPAMLFFSLSLLLLVLVLCQNIPMTIFSGGVLLVIGGLSFALAFSGRQPYLMCLGAFAIIPFYKLSADKRVWLALYVIICLIIPLCLFWIWKGLAPSIGGDYATKDFLSPLNFILGLGYSAMTMLFLAPGFFIPINKKITFGYIAISFMILSFCVYFHFGFIPMRTLFENILPKFILQYYGCFICTILIVIGIYFIHSLVKRGFEKKNDFTYVLISVMLFALIFSCIKVTHQFSSRYVFQAAPLFLIIASFYYKPKKYYLVLSALGLIIGVLSLVNYC